MCCYIHCANDHCINIHRDIIIVWVMLFYFMEIIHRTDCGCFLGYQAADRQTERNKLSIFYIRSCASTSDECMTGVPH